MVNSLTKIYLLVNYRLKKIIEKLLGLLELFLLLRLLLKFLNASPMAIVVKLIYQYTDILIFPFKSIFLDILLYEQYFIETATVSAMIGYWLAFLVIFELLRIYWRD